MNSQPSVQLHIERLIVDGSLLSNEQSRELQTAIETELAQLVREIGLVGLTSGVLYSLPTSDMHVAKPAPSAQIGRQIARTVYAALSPQSAPMQDRRRTVR